MHHRADEQDWVRWRRASAVGLGALLLSACAAKLIGIYEFRGTVDLIVLSALRGTRLPLPAIREGAVIGILALEAMIGGWLALSYRSPHRPALAAAALLVMFSGALVMLLLMKNPPSCGCLGSWDILRVSARADATIGLIRNTALIGLSVWLAAGPRASDRPPLARRDARRGFSIIELLVVIAVVAVLLAILLPSLAGVKRRARVVETMSALGQSVAGIVQYADAERGYLPFLGRVGDPLAGVLPDADWGDTVRPSFFKGHMALWPTALDSHGINLLGLPQNRRPDTGPARIATYLWMTHAAVSRPEYWINYDPPDSVQLFAGVRLDEVVFASQKGLLGDVGHFDTDPNNWGVAMFDGSAKYRSTNDPGLSIDDLPRGFGAVDWRVFTTHEGIRGRDY